jgi:hypothetical protein
LKNDDSEEVRTDISTEGFFMIGNLDTFETIS